MIKPNIARAVLACILLSALFICGFVQAAVAQAASLTADLQSGTPLTTGQEQAGTIPPPVVPAPAEPVVQTVYVTETVKIEVPVQVPVEVIVPVTQTVFFTETTQIQEIVPVTQTSYVTEVIPVEQTVLVTQTNYVTETVRVEEFVPVTQTTYVTEVIPLEQTVLVTQTNYVTETVRVEEIVPVTQTIAVTQTNLVTETVIVTQTQLVTETIQQIVPVTNTVVVTVVVSAPPDKSAPPPSTTPASAADVTPVSSALMGTTPITATGTVSVALSTPVSPTASNSRMPYVASWQSLTPTYYEQTPLPISGLAMYYANNVMDGVVRYRQRSGSVDECKECVGQVALLRAGDLNRRVWIRVGDGRVEGPFQVTDVAARHHVPGLLRRGWAVDVDYDTAMRWGMRGPVPVTIYSAPPVVVNASKPPGDG